MDFYEKMRKFCKIHDLILNRVKCLNDITEGAAVFKSRGATYSIWLWGRETVVWTAYDVEQASMAFEVMSVVERAIWDARRLGYVNFGGESA